MDMKLGDDIYESFRAYQKALLKEYGLMSDEFGFRVLDARRKVDVIQDELRRQIGAFLAESDAGEAEPATIQMPGRARRRLFTPNLHRRNCTETGPEILWRGRYAIWTQNGTGFRADNAKSPDRHRTAAVV